MANEILNMEELDQVSGGWSDQTQSDKEFFRQLGYNMDKISLEDAFLDNGVKFDGNLLSNNSYQFFSKASNKFENIPHWAALGYVLSRRKAPGFTESWTDSTYVCLYFKSHFGNINAFS